MAVVYLSPSGNDANTYLQAQDPATPWATIAKCDTSATNGDTISCAAGTYPWVAQTFTKAFTITAATAGTVIFDGAAQTFRWSLTGTYVFTNLKFRNNTNNEFTATFWAAGNPTTATFNNCTFNNLTFNNVAYGALVGYQDGTRGTYTFNTCIFYDCKKVASAGNNASLLGLCLAVTLNNCTVYLTATGTANVDFLYRYANGQAVTLKNSIFYNGSGEVVTLSTGAGAPTLSQTYCDFYLITSSPAGTGNITSDPLLIDAANANFNLRPTSPCLGTGIIV